MVELKSAKKKRRKKEKDRDRERPVEMHVILRLLKGKKIIKIYLNVSDI